MKVNIWNQVVEGGNGTVVMEPGDRLSIAFNDFAGGMQVITISAEGAVCVVAHEQTQDALVIRRGGNQYIKG